MTSKVTAEIIKQFQSTIMKHGDFSQVISKMVLTSVTPEKAIGHMVVEKEHTNRVGTLHGGLTCTLVDVIGGLPTVVSNPERVQPGVTIDLQVSFLNPAKLGDTIDIEGRVVKNGKKILFTELDITNRRTGKMVARGKCILLKIDP